MSWKPEVDGIEQRRRLAQQLGGADAVAKQHELLRLTIRERVDAWHAAVAFDLRQLIYKDLRFTGATIVPPGTMARVVRLIEQGLLKPLLAQTFPLRDLAKAQEAFMRKAHVGNIVVTT